MTDDSSLNLEAFLLREREEVEKALERSLRYFSGYLPTSLAEPVRHAVWLRFKWFEDNVVGWCTVDLDTDLTIGRCRSC